METTAAAPYHSNQKLVIHLDITNISWNFGSPLKDENTVGNGYQNGIKTPIFNHPPIIASELCRERLSKGRSRGSISQCRSRFPQIDFSLIEREDDILWEADERESNESVAAKGIKFIKWLLARKEKEIAVVSHGVFLQQTLIALKNEFDSSIEKEFLTPFGNCEIRSLKFFRESVVRLGQDYKKN
ncbi:hypothetical protein V6Z11_A07G009400 [Gossypium hirsutum]